MTLQDASALRVEPESVSERIFFLMRGREPSKADLAWHILKEKLEHIRSGKLVFLEIRPVYGANFLMLASKIELKTRTGDRATASATK